MLKTVSNHKVLAGLALAAALAACGGGGSGGGNAGGGNPGGGNNNPPPAAGTVAGTLSYEFVPANPNCNGLNFDPAVLQTRPIRGATVQLLDAAGAEIARTTSAEDGGYEFTNIDPGTTARLRVRAELKKTSGLSRWDVELRDNVVDVSATAPAPPPLGSRPLYVLDGATFTVTEAGASIDLVAETGWVGSGYVNDRAAAPFAVLDAIYRAMTFIEAVDPDVNFPALDAFWGVNNTADELAPAELQDLADRGFTILDSGNLGGSFYRIGTNQLFLTGDAQGDTEEFDSHIVVHEWGHYFEDNLSRSDSLGGSHALGDRLDARLAFGEGWAHALATMVLNDPVYCETSFGGAVSNFGFNAEGGVFGGQGWYDEISVLRFIYDLWDTTNEETDTGSIGFGPIYATMVSDQANSPAWTSLFSFSTDLKAKLDAAGAALVDAQLGDEQVDFTVLNIWGDGETNAAGATTDVLPVYIPYMAGDPPIEVCSNSQFDPRGDGNKLSQFRYLRVEVPANGQYHVTITAPNPPTPTADPNDRDQSDPDMQIRRGGALVEQLWSGAQNLETTVPPNGAGPLSLFEGTYVADLRDWRFADPEYDATYDVMCFDVEFSLAP